MQVLGILLFLTLAQTGDSLDLPIPQPVLGQNKKFQTEPPPPLPPIINETSPLDDGDDSRDTPPPVIFGEEIESENDTLIYVLDISGSMNNGYDPMIDYDGNETRGNKYFKAVSELIRSIRGLSENFQFNIVRYDCAIEVWQTGQFPPATSDWKAKAEAWVLSDTGGKRTPRKVPGGTATGPGTAVALGFKENDTVVLLTDGAPNCGASGLEGHRRLIMRENTQGATIDVFGIEAQAQFKTFCQQVASDSGGTYIDVP